MAVHKEVFKVPLVARAGCQRLGAQTPAACPTVLSCLEGRGSLQHLRGRPGPGLLCNLQLCRGIPPRAPGSALPWGLHFLESFVTLWSQGSRGLEEAGLLPGVT